MLESIQQHRASDAARPEPSKKAYAKTIMYLTLVIAVIVAGMLYGIENGLDAPPPVVGDAYKQHEAELPDNWPEALKRFRESAFIREYLGEDFQRIYASTKQQEIAEFDKHVTPIEYQAYL